MKILLVEDDEDKRCQVVQFLSDLVPDAVVEEAYSLRSGWQSILRNKHDLLILDMTMPTFDIGVGEDGGRPQAYGGRELLGHMRRRGIKTPAIVLTQFDRFGDGRELRTLEELDQELRRQYSDYYLGAIHYDVTHPTWKRELEIVVIRCRRGPGVKEQ